LPFKLVIGECEGEAEEFRQRRFGDVGEVDLAVRAGGGLVRGAPRAMRFLRGDAVNG